MATLSDAKRIASKLPGVESGLGVRVKDKVKGFAWPWNERVDPKKPRVPNLSVLAIRTANLEEKEMLIASDPEKFFTEPHYNNFPAVLVRLDKIEMDELEELLTDAWRRLAPKALVRDFDSGVS